MNLIPRTSVAGSCVGFIVIGASQAIYGPLIPFFQAKFSISPAMAGMSLSSHFIGALVGVLIFNRLDKLLKNKILISYSYILISLASFSLALSSNWNLVLASAFFIGIGFGGIDYGVNHLFSKSFTDSGVVMLNFLNAHFGLGAVLAPLLVGWLGSENYTWIFLAQAIIAALLLPTLRGISDAQVDTNQDKTKIFDVNQRIASITISFILVYILHVAIETGIGGWEPTHLELNGYSPQTAVLATSVFWFALTLGRFLVVPLGLMFSAATIFTGCCIGMAFCLILAGFSFLAPFAYVGVGLFIAPIFPTGLVWLKQLLPHAATPTAYVIASSMLGGVIFPPAIGKLIETLGVHLVPLVLLVLAIGCILPSLWLGYFAKNNQFIREAK